MIFAMENLHSYFYILIRVCSVIYIYFKITNDNDPGRNFSSMLFSFPGTATVAWDKKNQLASYSIAQLARQAHVSLLLLLFHMVISPSYLDSY